MRLALAQKHKLNNSPRAISRRMLQSRTIPVGFVFAVILLSTCRHAAAWGLTFTTNTFLTGPGPKCVAAADFNNDGRLDLVTADYGYAGYGNTLTVLTNNGNGIFGSNATLTVGDQPRSVVSFDVNNDGRPDLVCGCGGYPGYLKVLTNDGSGNFESAFTLTNIDPEYIVVGDLNGDHRLALACSDLVRDQVTVLTNDGTGAFGVSASVSSLNLSTLAMADVNGDGKLDVITANWDGFETSYSLMVFTNDGAGGFYSSATYVVNTTQPSFYPLMVVAVDINGDGKPDLCTGAPASPILTILTNDGSGVFGSNATLVQAGAPYCIVAADSNGDGKVDLISANGDNTMTVWTNNGWGRFGFNTTTNLGSGPFWAIAADVNNDGKLDLISANMHDGTLTVLINTASFPPPVSTPTATMDRRGDDLFVEWPSSSPGWALQEKPDLRRANWLPSGYGGYPIVDDGTNKSLFVPHSNGSGFFRLLHP